MSEEYVDNLPRHTRMLTTRTETCFTLNPGGQVHATDSSL